MRYSFIPARFSSVPHFRRNEQGSAMIAVVGVMAVMMIVSIVIAGATINAQGYTTSTRAGLQSVAAAESGINMVEVALREDTCAANYTREAAPAYSTQIHYSLSATNDVWIAGCPPLNTSAQRIRVTSTGGASSPGVAGATSGDATVIEAIFALETIPGVYPSGAAIYMHGGVTFKNNADLLVSEGGMAAIQVKDGNVTCSNNTVIQGDVVVENGNLDIVACTISGNAWVKGSAKLGTITGNLSAGSVNNQSGVKGTYTQGGTMPSIPDWVDLKYVPGDWVDSDGVAYKVTPIGADCKISPTMLATASNGGKPVIINALGTCSTGVTASGNVNLTSDTVIFASRFNFAQFGVTWKSSNTQQRKLWFITPDNTANNMPDCGGQGNFEMKNNFVIDKNYVSAMVYTPCEFDAKNNFEWRGQIYANGANDFQNNTLFIFNAHGLPNVDLNTGQPMVGGVIGSTAKLGERLSVRDVAE